MIVPVKLTVVPLSRVKCVPDVPSSPACVNRPPILSVGLPRLVDAVIVPVLVHWLVLLPSLMPSVPLPAMLILPLLVKTLLPEAPPVMARLLPGVVKMDPALLPAAPKLNGDGTGRDAIGCDGSVIGDVAVGADGDVLPLDGDAAAKRQRCVERVHRVSGVAADDDGAARGGGHRLREQAVDARVGEVERAAHAGVRRAQVQRGVEDQVVNDVEAWILVVGVEG